MKKLLHILFFILSFCATAFGQSNSPCPTINVVEPSTVTKPGEAIPFKISLSDETKNLKLEFKWTVLGGQIIEGQGTVSIKVESARLREQLITATVEIKGLPENCINKFSGTAALTINLVRQEYETKSSFRERAELDKSVIILQDKDLIVVFYLNFKNPTSKQINSRISRILKHFAYRKALFKDRLSFVIRKSDRDFNQIFYEFKGDKKVECSNCKIIKVIKGSDFNLKKSQKL